MHSVSHRPRIHPRIHPRHRTSNRTGFNLIELLVVMALIAVLVAMLIPAVSKAKSAAAVIVCASTERQLLLGLTCYTNDNANNLPPHNIVSGPMAGNYTDWGTRAPTTIMGANFQRTAQAGGPYGNYMGLGHVVAGGYYSDANALKPIFEPTMRFPTVAGSDSPELFQFTNSFRWRSYRLNGGINAPAVFTAYIGYYYRGWLNVVDYAARPKLDMMGKKAAIWDHMADWNSQIQVTLTHDNGYNVGHYDGHVSRFVDPNGKFTFSNTYWSEAVELYTLFDVQ